MEHYPISKKEILSRINLKPSHKIYYFYAWLCFIALIAISCISVRALDYLFKHKPMIEIFSNTEMYIQMITFALVYSILFIIQPKQLHHIFPFFMTKKWMNPSLVTDITQAHYQVDTVTLLQIENITATDLIPAHQRLYLWSEQQQSPAWFTVYSSLLWAMPQRDFEFCLTDDCIGQKLKICYLPQSQIILQLFAQQNLQQDLAYSRVLQRLYQQLPSEKIKHIPSQLQYALLGCQSIHAQSISTHQKDFQLEIVTAQQKQISILSTEPHFDLFYSVLQQKYKLLDLAKVEQQVNSSSKIITLYDLPKQIRMMRWVLLAISGLLFIFALWHTIFVFFAVFMLIAALFTNFITSQFNYLKILQSD